MELIVIILIMIMIIILTMMMTIIIMMTTIRHSTDENTPIQLWSCIDDDHDQVF